jgi:hypothetical protein
VQDFGGLYPLRPNKTCVGSKDKQLWPCAGQNRWGPVLTRPGSILLRFGNLACVAEGESRSLTEGTQQRIVKALEQAFSDLDAWMKELGVSKRQVVPIYEKAVREGGMLSKLLAGIGCRILSLSAGPTPKLESFENAVGWIRSTEFATQLQQAPDPGEDKVRELESACKNALPALRKRLAYATRAGPQLHRGGRRKELSDPVVRRQICDEIKQRRGPGSKLDVLFKSIARKYKVSDTTIKRIWLECGKTE